MPVCTIRARRPAFCSPRSIAARPSNLVAKVQHILAWFERYDVDEAGEE